MASPITRFKGLNNVTDPLRLDMSWLVRADNVDVTDSGAIQAREGYGLARPVAGTPRGAYNTTDFSRLYSVEGTNLVSTHADMSASVLRTGLAAARMSFAEVNDQVFYSNGIDDGIIDADDSLTTWSWPVPAAPLLSASSGALDAGQYLVRCALVAADGRLTGPSEVAAITLDGSSALQITGIPQVAGYSTNVYICPANGSEFYLAARAAPAAITWTQSANTLGEPLTTLGLSPLPAGCDVIQFWGARAYAAMYMPGAADQTVVWVSKPLAFHLFQLDTDGFIVKGRVLCMAPDEKALIIGTDRAIYAYADGKLTTLADYGVVPGRSWVTDATNSGSFAPSANESRTLLWTVRGLCQALPFKNLTDQQVSVPPGTFAGGALVQRDGRARFLVALQMGGSAFNPRKA